MVTCAEQPTAVCISYKLTGRRLKIFVCESGVPLYCLPAVVLLPAAVLAFYSPSPSSLRWARGQLKDKRTGHRLKGGRGVREEKRKEKPQKVSELRGLGQKRNRRDGAVCLGKRRTLGAAEGDRAMCKGRVGERRGEG
ncbi:hypothetical protein INR49_031843 [Caranx melampygus]|nr:hypothetical protein INR49_031843 [Caranx melampygus]